MQALLTGCSVGGLSAFFHCDDFHNLLHRSAKVKCMPDAGFFIDLYVLNKILSEITHVDICSVFHNLGIFRTSINFIYTRVPCKWCRKDVSGVYQLRTLYQEVITLHVHILELFFTDLIFAII
jgi:hypothetical protein